MKLCAEAEWDATRFMDDGACVGMDFRIWFPTRGGSSLAAKSICKGCPVRAECFLYAMGQNEKYGTWGGISERERRALRRRWNAGDRTIPEVNLNGPGSVTNLKGAKNRRPALRLAESA